MFNKCVYKLNNEYLREILNIHFDKEEGAKYWLEREKQLKINTLEEINDFKKFKQYYSFKNRNEMDKYENDLRHRQVEDFIPLSASKGDKWIWTAETGGTTGIAKRGTWGSIYWESILNFSDEFLNLHCVPKNENWLFIGPTGPHTTGRLMVSIAENRGGKIFCIDMDPRIVRTYLQEGNGEAVNKYIQHIWDQVDPIIRYQNIGVLFCTSSLLELLPQYMDINLFKNIKAVLHAGLAMSRDTHKYLRENLFKGKAIVGIYGTSVSGISYQKPYEKEDNYHVIYIPSQPYIVIDIINGEGLPVNYGEEGEVRCFRFTEDSIIPGFIERDKAVRIKPFGKFASTYNWDWISDPHSPAGLSGQKMEGVY
ncbi:hypothetical protein [Pelosinus fermentans]|uniref:AMP-dependent synthetase and ligase n=1 Tax=Pelosinus fermentans JBW45 TaxID=1192197 RepID=I9NRE1_9FIRM|nr:hypothetical protein [Pelosinus fermentans]AJQ26595.1 hypothetical protein JBW_01243 [Pelosinus fermentans JBW45]